MQTTPAHGQMSQSTKQGKVDAKFFAYLATLLSLAKENVAVADVTTPFAELLKRKEFSDLSGNNFNHPNDFTHRLYAQVICQLFPPAKISAEVKGRPLALYSRHR